MYQSYEFVGENKRGSEPVRKKPLRINIWHKTASVTPASIGWFPQSVPGPRGGTSLIKEQSWLSDCIAGHGEGTGQGHHRALTGKHVKG